jgi:hypothetical protein
MAHHCIMRTTVDIPDHLLVQAKKRAAAQHTSVTRLVVAGLRRYLSEERARPARPKSLPVNRRARLVSGVDLDDTSELWDLP